MAPIETIKTLIPNITTINKNKVIMHIPDGLDIGFTADKTGKYIVFADSSNNTIMNGEEIQLSNGTKILTTTNKTGKQISYFDKISDNFKINDIRKTDKFIFIVISTYANKIRYRHRYNLEKNRMEEFDTLQEIQIIKTSPTSDDEKNMFISAALNDMYIYIHTNKYNTLQKINLHNLYDIRTRNESLQVTIDAIENETLICKHVFDIQNNIYEENLKIKISSIQSLQSIDNKELHKVMQMISTLPLFFNNKTETIRTPQELQHAILHYVNHVFKVVTIQFCANDTNHIELLKLNCLFDDVRKAECHALDMKYNASKRY